jgi:hypothetical protein
LPSNDSGAGWSEAKAKTSKQQSLCQKERAARHTRLTKILPRGQKPKQKTQQNRKVSKVSTFLWTVVETPAKIKVTRVPDEFVL